MAADAEKALCFGGGHQRVDHFFELENQFEMCIRDRFGAAGGVIGFIARLMPTTAVLDLVYAAMGLQALDLVSSMLVLAVWRVLSAAVFALIYKKKRLDN